MNLCKKFKKTDKMTLAEWKMRKNRFLWQKSREKELAKQNLNLTKPFHFDNKVFRILKTVCWNKLTVAELLAEALNVANVAFKRVLCGKLVTVCERKEEIAVKAECDNEDENLSENGCLQFWDIIWRQSECTLIWVESVLQCVSLLYRNVNQSCHQKLCRGKNSL